MAIVGVLGLTAASSVYSGSQQKKGAKAAANAQNAMDQRAIAEQQRQFDALQSLMCRPVLGLSALNKIC